MNFEKQNIDSLTVVEKEVLLNKLRKKVDFIDRILVYILNRRTKIAILIGRIKLSLNLPTYAPEREKDVMAKVYKHNNGPLTEESLERIYERILDQSRATQKSESPKLFSKADDAKE
ncbi:MAG: chorismate mutase [Ignavibacteriales bacterium]|nr:chorismate mutase [Ignavibacteriales bacterium]